ncbi:MAG: aspartate aminotransferase family protein [Ilumatobacteraceae bacterium]
MPGSFLHPFAKPSREQFISVTRGEGALVWTDDGRQLIDAMSSLWYCNIGHGRAEMAEVVAEQLRTIGEFHCFDPFTNAPADALAERIVGLSPLEDARVFLTCSGSEAVDTAMKIARVAHAQSGHPERQLIISRDRGYHGTNYGGTSAQGLPPNKVGFGELLSGVVQVPSEDIEGLSRLMAERSAEIAAVVTEPIQGAGGVFPPPPGYLAELRRLCDQHGALLIFDEVITGFGRTGEWFAAQHFDVAPDLTIFAKAVTSGYQPLGGVIVGRTACDALESDPDFILRTGYTYSGHPAACVAALQNIEILERENLLPRAVKIGSRLETGLRAIAADGGIDEVRGDGAMWAAGLRSDQDAAQVRDTMLEHGVAARPIGPETVTFCPPLVTTDEQIDQIVDALAAAVA